MTRTQAQTMEIGKQKEADRLEFRVSYPHPVERVWSAITEPAQIERWFTKMNIEATVGTSYELIHEGAVAVTGRILTVDRPKCFQYSWIVSGTDVETIVTWRLAAEDGGGTTLVLEHTGLTAYEGSAASMIANFEHGWERCVTALADHLGTSTA